MKYYKFIEELDWERLLEKIEEAEEKGFGCDEIEIEMDKLVSNTQPVDVDEVDESVDGLYIDLDEPDESLGGEYVFAEVVYQNDIVYEFEYELEVLKGLLDN